MLRFEVYRNGQAAKKITLAGAYVFGQGGVPICAKLDAEGAVIECTNQAPGAQGLALLWDVSPAGRYLLPTTRLPQREKPYILNVELARAQVMRLIQKREDWGLFDYADADALNREFDEVRSDFVESLKAGSPSQSAVLADKALLAGVTLGEKLSLFHADILLKRRLALPLPKPGCGCMVDPLCPDRNHEVLLEGAFDFLSLPMQWKRIEPKEDQHHYAQIDAWIRWAARDKMLVHAGPLLSFDPADLPEWLYIWEHDFEAVRDLIYEHIRHLVQHYEGQVHVWKVVSGIHAHNTFQFSVEQLTELTRMSCLLVKSLAPQAKVLIELVSPWGEYYARDRTTIPPLIYADTVIQSGIKFDAFGVQFQMGVPLDGLYVRDLLQVSSLLDEFLIFGKPVHITACQVPSGCAVDARDAWQGQYRARDAGNWHGAWTQRLQAEWLKAFCRIGLSKPFVESICWRDLADCEGHFLPHGGLCRSDLQPKLAYQEVRKLRAGLVNGRSAVGAGGRAKE